MSSWPGKLAGEGNLLNLLLKQSIRWTCWCPRFRAFIHAVHACRSHTLQKELEELVLSLSAQGRGAAGTSPPRPSRSQQQRHTRPVSPAWSPAGRAAVRSPARGGGGALRAESFGLEGRYRYVGPEQDGVAREYPEVCSHRSSLPCRLHSEPQLCLALSAGSP